MKKAIFFLMFLIPQSLFLKSLQQYEESISYRCSRCNKKLTQQELVVCWMASSKTQKDLTYLCKKCREEAKVGGANAAVAVLTNNPSYSAHTPPSYDQTYSADQAIESYFKMKGYFEQGVIHARGYHWQLSIKRGLNDAKLLCKPLGNGKSYELRPPFMGGKKSHAISEIIPLGNIFLFVTEEEDNRCKLYSFNPFSKEYKQIESGDLLALMAQFDETRDVDIQKERALLEALYSEDKKYKVCETVKSSCADGRSCEVTLDNTSGQSLLFVNKGNGDYFDIKAPTRYQDARTHQPTEYFKIYTVKPEASGTFLLFSKQAPRRDGEGETVFRYDPYDGESGVYSLVKPRIRKDTSSR